jgi:hypothetical protein
MLDLSSAGTVKNDAPPDRRVDARYVACDRTSVIVMFMCGGHSLSGRLTLTFWTFGA